jgi:MFS family permease
MTGVIMVSAIITTTKLRDRFGPRALSVVGMLFGAAGMLLLTRIGLHSTYAADILPALVVMGAGIGFVIASGMYGATLGVRPGDAGVASATVTASQQVGGSLGTALLSTLAASAATSYVAGHLTGGRPTAGLVASASVHGYTVGFAVAAAIFLAGALVSALLFERGVPQHAGAGATEPVLAH